MLSAENKIVIMTIDDYIQIIRRRLKEMSHDVKQVVRSFPKENDEGFSKGTYYVGFALDKFVIEREAIHILFDEIEKLARQKDKIRFWFYVR